MDHYSKFCYAHLIRVTPSEETLHAKESYECLESTHRDRVCAYRADNGRFVDLLFKNAVQTCVKQISYCGVGSHNQNVIVKCRIK